MVDYARAEATTVDPGRIVVTGVSSGAMMTNVLPAQYPDVFAAGSAFMGVPVRLLRHHRRLHAGTTSAPADTSSRPRSSGATRPARCTPGTPARTPGCSCGTATTDTTLNYPNYGEEIKQWTNLHGVSPTPTITDSPQSAWTRTRYGTDTSRPPSRASASPVSVTPCPRTAWSNTPSTFLGLAQHHGDPDARRRPSTPTVTPDRRLRPSPPR